MTGLNIILIMDQLQHFQRDHTIVLEEIPSMSPLPEEENLENLSVEAKQIRGDDGPFGFQQMKTRYQRQYLFKSREHPIKIIDSVLFNQEFDQIVHNYQSSY
jgi:hypothetical protein